MIDARIRGFTLIELVVVLALAAISVAFVGGAAQAYYLKSQYHSSVREVLALISAARVRANAISQDQCVVYQPRQRVLVVNDSNYHIPESVDVEWSGIQSPRCSTDGVVLFVLRSNGYGYGGVFKLFRNSIGTGISVNWLLGSVETQGLSRN